MISCFDASVILLGHSHLQWYGYCDDKLIINPGSCGQPLDFDTRASYTILNSDIYGLSVEEKRVSYDIEKTISTSKNSKVYEKRSIWCRLVFLAMRTGKDVFSEFFALAENIAKDKNETNKFFTNDTWNLAGEIYFDKNTDDMPTRIKVT